MFFKLFSVQAFFYHKLKGINLKSLTKLNTKFKWTENHFYKTTVNMMKHKMLRLTIMTFNSNVKSKNYI